MEAGGDRRYPQVLQSAKEIVDAGLDDPAFFELLALFETEIGADRAGRHARQHRSSTPRRLYETRL